MEDAPDKPAIRVTFEEAAPLFQHELHEELAAEGFDVQLGPPPMEQRSARDVIDSRRVVVTRSALEKLQEALA